MQLHRLCVVLPTDADELDPPPSSSHHNPDDNVSTLDAGKEAARRASAFLRRSLHLFCRRLRWVSLGCCVPRHDDDLRRLEDDSSEFQDIPGVVVHPAGDNRAGADGNPRVFSYAELYIGTSGFGEGELLGSGGYGRVYRAVLPSDGTVVAVKRVAAGGRGDQF